MCQVKSAIVVKEPRNKGGFQLLMSPWTESHSELITIHKLKDDARLKFARVEFSPPSMEQAYLPETYSLRIDEERTPEWFDPEMKEAVTAKMLAYIKTIIISGDVQLLIGGQFIIAPCAKVECAHSVVINAMCGGTLTAMRGGTLTEMYGGTLTEMYGGTLTAMRGGTLTEMRGGTLNAMYGGTLNAMYGGTLTTMHGGTLTAMYGGTLNAMYGGTLNAMYGGTLNAMHGGTLTAMCGGTLTAMRGGTLTAMYGGTLTEIKEWFTGIIGTVAKAAKILTDNRKK
jgi:hypothetical protein